MSQVAYFLKQLIIFSNTSCSCRQKEVLLQEVNFTGYRLTRRTPNAELDKNKYNAMKLQQTIP